MAEVIPNTDRTDEEFGPFCCASETAACRNLRSLAADTASLFEQA